MFISQVEESGSEDDADDYQPYIPIKQRKKMQMSKLAKLGRAKQLAKMEERKASSSEAGSDAEKSEPEVGPQAHVSLIDQHSRLKREEEARKETEREKILREEQRILESVKEKTALMGVGELAMGIQYTDPLKTGWKPPRYILNMPEERHARVRKRLQILVEGEDLPPPIKTFDGMKFPKSLDSMKSCL